MKTALEWLVDNLKKNHGLDLTLYSEFNQANKMFEEQVIDAYETSHISMMTAKQYYNETYKNN
jgi:hypothetical protein